MRYAAWLMTGALTAYVVVHQGRAIQYGTVLDMNSPSVTISARGIERIVSGHPWIYRGDLADSAGERPGTVLRRLAEAYASGAPVPFIPDLGEPKSQRRLIRPADRVLFSFMLEIEMSKRAYGRAHADGLSLSAIMRRFVVAYVRRERAARRPRPEPGGASRTTIEADEGRSSRMKE